MPASRERTTAANIATTSIYTHVCTDDSDDTLATVCRDLDADTCDDCSSGTDDPSDDGKRT